MTVVSFVARLLCAKDEGWAAKHAEDTTANDTPMIAFFSPCPEQPFIIVARQTRQALVKGSNFALPATTLQRLTRLLAQGSELHCTVAS